MENKDISQIAIERIKEKGIKPIPRQVFSIKRVMFWVVVGSSFIVGAFSFSLILSALLNNDWDLYNRFGFNFIVKTLPYFWLISLLVFTILGEYYYRKTLLGHRRGFILIVGIYLFSTTAFGTIFYALGFGEFMEKNLGEVPETYRSIILNRQEFWFNPDQGLLTGKIILVNDDTIQIIDSHGGIWTVDRKESLTRGQAIIEIGEKIKIVGSKIESGIFKALEIRPWMGNHSGNRNNPNPGFMMR